MVVYKQFDKFISKLKFRRSNYYSCVYIKECAEKEEVYLLLYVDDMLLAESDLTELNEIKAQMSEEFEKKDLGAARKVLVMEIYRNWSKREYFYAIRFEGMRALRNWINFKQNHYST